jgi:hypothetical protein
VAAELQIPNDLKRARWKVKIRDKETREPPHATIIQGTKCWRLNLRDRQFMDKKPKPSEVPEKLLDHILKEENWEWLKHEWNRLYPANPVEADDDGDDEAENDDES